MSDPLAPSWPVIDNVLHPSDFTEASQVAFAHALKIALVAHSQLTLLHVTQEEGTDWADFPGVRPTLERWGLIPAGSPKSAIPQLGIDVRKVIEHHDDPVQAVLYYLEKHGADLIVLAPHHHASHGSWFQKSISEPVARKSNQMTLFVPAGVRGFVSEEDGSVSLKHILIPVAEHPRSEPSVTAAARLVQLLGCSFGSFTQFHVGDAGSMPIMPTPDVPGWQWRRLTKPGDVITEILETARETHADLIVMSTSGHHGFLDGLRGTHSERVLRRAPCPLLVIPETSQVANSLA